MEPLSFLLGAIVLAGLELMSGELTLLMLAAGAGSAAIAGYLGAPLIPMIVIFAIVSLSMILFVKPLIKKQITQGLRLDTSPKALVGREAIVLENTTSTGGQVRLDGEIWSARTGLTQLELAKGQKVSVIDIDGATAIVIPIGDV